MKRSLTIGTFAFTLVSIIVFATVAWRERWIYQTMGLWGAYGFWIVLFIVGGGSAFYPIVKNNTGRMKFYAVFFTAFLLYSVAWILSYMWLRNAMGEWLGSLTGSLCLALVFTGYFKNWKSFVPIAIVIFFSNSFGYFSGRDVHQILGNPWGMLIWGVTFGIGLGLGLSYILHLSSSNEESGE